MVERHVRRDARGLVEVPDRVTETARLVRDQPQDMQRLRRLRRDREHAAARGLGLGEPARGAKLPGKSNQVGDRQQLSGRTGRSDFHSRHPASCACSSADSTVPDRGSSHLAYRATGAGSSVEKPTQAVIRIPQYRSIAPTGCNNRSHEGRFTGKNTANGAPKPPWAVLGGGLDRTCARGATPHRKAEKECENSPNRSHRACRGWRALSYWRRLRWSAWRWRPGLRPRRSHNVFPPIVMSPWPAAPTPERSRNLPSRIRASAQASSIPAPSRPADSR